MSLFAALLVTFLPNGLDIDRAYPRPLDFKFDKDHPGAYLSAIQQIECDGRRLYFRSGREPYVLITDLEGRVISILGGKGGHPSEFGDQGVLAMAVDGKTVAAIDMGSRFIRFYESGAYLSNLRLHSYNARAPHATSNIFAFSHDHAVVPGQWPGHLAVVYERGREGQRSIGELLEIGDEDERTALNATLWTYHEGSWYAVHKFFPMVSVFDQRFELVRQFQIRHELADKYITYLADFRPNENFTQAQPLVSDFKLFRHDLFVMMQSNLFQVDSRNGEVLSITHFFGKGANFGPADGHKINLPRFAFAQDGRLFAAHPALLWQHDFWQVALPVFAGKSRRENVH